MRRYVRAPGARFAPDSSGPVDRLRRLRRALTPEEYGALRRLTGGLRRLPFGEDPEVLEHVLLCASDDEVELLAKCQSALRDDGGDAEPDPDLDQGPDAAARAARLQFRFEPDSLELGPFLGSLRRNGFRAVSIGAGGDVVVFVDLEGLSDLEVERSMALVQSLRDIVRTTAQHALRGHRVGR